MTREEVERAIEFLEKNALSDEAVSMLYALTGKDEAGYKLSVVNIVKKIVHEYIAVHAESLSDAVEVLSAYSEIFELCLKVIKAVQELEDDA